MDILLLSSANLDTELEKLNTDEATRQNVINAVNSGKVVTIPAENVTMGVTMGDWHGTGYIVTNPETGVGAYMISGGHNGGMVNTIITMTLLAGLMASAVNGVFIIAGLLSLISSAATINLFAGFIMSALSIAALFINFRIVDGMIQDYFYFLETGDLEAVERIAKETLGEGIALAVNVLMLVIAEAVMNGGGSSNLKYQNVSAWEIATKRTANVNELSPNPLDEFSNTAIGPSDIAVSKYIEEIKRTGTISEPIIVQKLTAGGYEIVNGHHRWWAVIKSGLETVPIKIINLLN